MRPGLPPGQPNVYTPVCYEPMHCSSSSSSIIGCGNPFAVLHITHPSHRPMRDVKDSKWFTAACNETG